MKPTSTHLHLENTAAYGANTHRGNLLGVQPFMTTADYASEERFAAKMDGYLNVAREKGWLNEKTIVVLPEYIGAWLVACSEKQSLYQAGSVEEAMRVLALSNLFPFLKALLAAKGEDKVKDSLFRMKASLMAAVYQNTFAGLAREYGVTIVAGSLVLPSPRVENGRLAIGNGPLYNVSVVYKPDGSAHDAVVRKVYPISDELPFTAGAPAAELPVFATPAGRLGVLICADSWYAATYAALKAKGCDLIAVPNNLMPDGVWRQPWRGYTPGPEPEDVDAGDVGRLNEGEAWLKYALAGRLASAGATHGLHAFFRGQLWDLSGDGHMILVDGQMVWEAEHVEGAAVVNFWL